MRGHADEGTGFFVIYLPCRCVVIAGGSVSGRGFAENKELLKRGGMPPLPRGRFDKKPAGGRGR